jgi:Cu-Zn family superoxide dismutase
MMVFRGATLAAMLWVASGPVWAEDLTVPMTLLTQAGVGTAVGRIVIHQTPDGATFQLALHNLPPGPHGFHIHENGECGPTMMNGVAIPGGATGRHWDPGETFRHAGPTGDGHLGDLPVLDVADDGSATQTLAASRIKDLDKIRGKALVITRQGDNYSDKPEIGGGGGGRLACGAIP